MGQGRAWLKSPAEPPIEVFMMRIVYVLPLSAVLLCAASLRSDAAAENTPLTHARRVAGGFGTPSVIGTDGTSPLEIDAEGTAILTSDGTTTTIVPGGDSSLTIGNTSGTSTTDIRGSAGATLAAWGDVTVDTHAALSLGGSAATVEIGNSNGPFAASGSSFSLDCGGVPDCQVNIGNSAWSHDVSLGSTTGNSALTLGAGTGQLLINHGSLSWAWPTADGLVDSWALITDSHGNLYFAPPMAGPQSIVQVTCTLVAGAATCPSGYNLDAPAGAAKIVGPPALQVPNGSTELGVAVNAYILGNSVALTSYTAAAGLATGDASTYLVSVIGAQAE
jgi:hypothetical protein